ncbi:MAG: peptide chain release factor 1 [Alphaproteobacteria bacterium]|nr:peptide chain release factor 1 [Alphaproteobacteria bacterium]
MSLDESLRKVLVRHRELGEMLSEAGVANDPAVFARLSKEYADLRPVAERIEVLKRARSEMADLEEIAVDSEGDKEMRAMAKEEWEDFKSLIPDLEQELKVLLLPKDAADEKNAIIEVRAGTGGDEATLFAANLFRMYQRYAERHDWKFDIMNLNETGIGGFKEAIASISGEGVFARLKFESGTHRVQRVPETESGGRIHTSAATVAVLPEAEEVDITIEDKDLRVDVYRASGPGGQSVNTTDSAVRITHVPTGIVAQCQDEKSQHKNKAKALKVLRARLYEAERQAAESERADMRKNQVGSGDRSERIRTYNFPQGRVTDHRINLTLHKIEQIIEGEGLDEIIDALTPEDQAARLAAMS